MVLPVAGVLVGASITVDGVAFDDVANAGPKTVDYQGPETFRAVSGRPYLQGPVVWVCRWPAATSDTFVALYTIWNQKLNTASGPRVTLAINDPRNAGSVQSYEMWMDEPQFGMGELLVRDVIVTFTSVLPE